MQKLRLSLVWIVLWISACTSTPVTTPPQVSTGTANATPSAARAAAPSGSSAPVQSAATAIAQHLDPSSLLNREHSIYFDYDEAIVRSEYAPLIERHGQYLRGRGALKIVVQGNSDERGGAEYNLALGQRRADAVKAALNLYGVTDVQVEAVSFGEEKPSSAGHDESAWKRNRRADIVYVK